MKAKVKKKTAHQKAVERMELEVKRSLSHVFLLEKLHEEMMKKKEKVG